MQGNELLETIGGCGTDAVAAVLRHAARHPIADPTMPLLAELTPAGEQAAEAFGRRITGFGHLRLFHSPVKRCRQTAEGIAAGAREAGLAVDLVGPQAELGVEYILDQIGTGHLSKEHGEHFVRLWFTAGIPGHLIEPAPVIARRMLALLEARLREPAAAGRRLDLHVTHDWNIVILRELLLQVRHEEAGWPPFLDGVTFSESHGRLQAVFRHHGGAVPAFPD